MNKSSRFEMRIHPDKLMVYKRQASIYGMPLSRWFELIADCAIAEKKEGHTKEVIGG